MRRSDAEMIRAIGTAFTNVIREANGQPPIEQEVKHSDILTWLRDFRERRRLFNRAMDARIAAMEASLRPATENTEATDTPTRCQCGLTPDACRVTRCDMGD